jgi:gluconate 2-dehydrogenase gamma chain
MADQGIGRRDLFKSVAVGGAVAATGGLAASEPATAQQAAHAPAPGYTFLNLEEAAFVEALVDHMIPADNLTPKGTEVGVNVYIDRALTGAWGKGDRLYMQGPWKKGSPSQGYQLPLTPAQLYRAGIAATNAHARKAYGKPFDRLDDDKKQEILVALSTGKLAFDDGLPAGVFWSVVYQTVIEGMFSDPIYGGNRDKAGWKMIGFPGAMAINRENIVKYRDRPVPTAPKGIEDLT